MTEGGLSLFSAVLKAQLECCPVCPVERSEQTGEYPEKRNICLKFRKDALQERMKKCVFGGFAQSR